MMLTVRALGDSRSQEARVVSAEKLGMGSGWRVAKAGRVVGRGEDRVGVTTAEPPLSAGLLDGGRAAGDVLGLEATSLDLVGAVAEGSLARRGEERTALGNLLVQVVARVGGRETSKEQARGDGARETHLGWKIGGKGMLDDMTSRRLNDV